MPILKPSSYRPPPGFANGHLQTIFPGLFRRVRVGPYRRERIDTPDGDFLDLDWLAGDATRLAVVSYGMEGNSQRPYVRGMVRALNAAGWDALVWNFRGCSDEPNRKVHFYHSGMIEDLDAVISHALRDGRYAELALVGFSLGGNMLLNYLGRHGRNIPAPLKKAVAISVPCDVEDCAQQLRRPENRLYVRRFLNSFHKKIRAKMKMLPGQIDDESFRKIHTIEEYDECYTLRHFGFPNLPAFYRSVSSKYVLPSIRIPALILNARNDSFIGRPSMPVEEAQANARLFLEAPASGGHIGFVTFGDHGQYWSENRTVAFLESPSA